MEQLGTLSTAVQTAAVIHTKREDFEFLQADFESAKRFASSMRNVVNSVLRSPNLPPTCYLEPVVQAYRAFQYFLETETQGKANAANMRAFPEWYRNRVARHTSNMQNEYLLFQMEMQLYANLLLNNLLAQRSKPETVHVLLDKLISDVRTESRQCHYFYDGFVREVQTQPNILCPRCFYPTAGTPDVTQQELARHAKPTAPSS